MTRNERWLIAGLGNAGPWFAGTRHNAGFSVVEHLAEREGTRFRGAGARCRVAEIDLAGQPVILAKPLWNINRSGPPLARLLRARGITVAGLLVVQDDLDFPFGTLRLKRAGGPGGHNGVRSVAEALGTRDFLRLRFGVGRPVRGQSMGRFVLGRFTEAEQVQFPALLDRCATALATLMTSGLDKAQTELHSDVACR